MSSGVVGRRVRRPDALPRVTGREHYVDDLKLPGMLHAHLVLSTHARAAIRAIDTSPAQVSPGVVAVLTARDFPAVAQNDEPPERARFFLARDRVGYVGQPLAVVLAQSAADAELAAELVTVDYQPEEPLVDLDAALAPGARAVRRMAGSSDEASEHGADAVVPAGADERANVSASVVFARGDVERALAEAPFRVEREFRAQAIYQSYLEPRSVIAAVDPSGGLEIYAATQAQFNVRAAVARALGLEQAEVHVHPQAVGGGFGAKFVLLEPLAGVLAQRCGRPVKLTLPRQQDFVSTTPTLASKLRVALAADAAGHLTALRAELAWDTGYFSNSPYLLAAMMIGGFYRIPNLRVESIEVQTNHAGAGAYRGPGLPQTAFAVETLLDELAERLELSPLELRRRNVVGGGDLMPDGSPWLAVEWEPVLDELARSPLLREPLGPDEGVGIAIGGLRGGIEPASAGARLDGDGILRVIVGSIDLTGTNTGLAQLAAETFGVPFERVRVVTAPTDYAPPSPGTGGSRILYTMGNAVVAAVADARRQALTIAAEQLEASADDLEIVEDRVQVRGAPGRALSLAQLAALSATPGAGYAPILGRGSVANPTKAPSPAAHAARVRVDRDTGEVTLTGYVAVHDVGRAVNPGEVEGQIHGAVAQGVGWGLLEALRYDEHGQLLTGSFMDYAIPRAGNAPVVESRIVETPAPAGPFGVRGLGEAPVVPPAAAIANAVYHATGHRFTALPITPQDVWQALSDARRKD